jgi:hypothetical protein
MPSTDVARELAFYELVRPAADERLAGRMDFQAESGQPS